MYIKSLNTIPFSDLMDCFLKAFDNYFVKMPTSHEFYEKRWKMAKVRYDLSYGMFDKEQLVGFIIHAIDQRNGQKIAFNTGTGVLPEYRGKRIVKSIYRHAIPLLKKHGITICQLEVITENIAAIKSYEGIGFSIRKEYKCYNGTIQNFKKTTKYALKKVTAAYLNWDMLRQESYSWDNHKNTIVHGTYDYFIVNHNDIDESYFIINSETGYIAQLDILNTSTIKSWERLATAIQEVSTTMKINNVYSRLHDKIKFLQHIGLNNTVDQYEMEMIIS